MYLFSRFSLAATTLALVAMFSCTATADLLTVTSVTDTVRIVHAPGSVDQTDTRNGLAGNVFATGNGQFLSEIVSAYDKEETSGVFSGWFGLSAEFNHQFDNTALSAPDTELTGSTVVEFTLNQDAIGMGASEGWNGYVLPPNFTERTNGLLKNSLFDVAQGQYVFQNQVGWINNTNVTQFNGQNGGSLAAGQYRWESSWVTSNNGITHPDGLFDNVRGSSGVFFEPAAVPEPTSIALLGFAGLGLCFRRRRVRK